MAQPELGTKRVCVSCSARFYDMTKNPAICPKCGAPQPAEVPRLRRTGEPVPAEPIKQIKPVDAAEDDIDIDTDDDADADVVIEDAEDLDDDADDIGADIDVSTDSDDHDQ